MALVKFTELIDGIRGTSGTTTWTAGKSGPYIKRWRMPVIRNRPLQTRARAILSAFAAAWRSLDAGQRNAWDTYAADPAQEKTNSLGEPYYASGFNWFCQVNRQLETAARAQTEDPPAINTPSAPGLVSAELYSPEAAPKLSKLNIASIEWTNFDAILFAVLYPGPGTLTASNNWLLLLATDADGLSEILLNDPLVNLFGVYSLGNRCFFHLARQSYDGARSPFHPLYADVESP
jgi:hypothetical protein